LKTHKDLDVWKEGIDIVEHIYTLTRIFPKEEKFGLVDQLKRSAVSITGNIAEGAARNSKKEFIQFLYIALGSLSELDTQLIIAQRLQFLEDTAVFAHLERQKSKMLGLIKYLKGNQ
jgi:four helix bundle protein